MSDTQRTINLTDVRAKVDAARLIVQSLGEELNQSEATHEQQLATSILNDLTKLVHTLTRNIVVEDSSCNVCVILKLPCHRARTSS